MLAPIVKFIIFIFSWKIKTENNIANGIFKLFIIASVEDFTVTLPLFHSQNPIPVGIIAKYKIDKICGIVIEIVAKFILKILITKDFRVFCMWNVLWVLKQGFNVQKLSTLFKSGRPSPVECLDWWDRIW